MRIFALIPALAAFVTVVAGAAVPADTSCGLEIGCGDIESHIALSISPLDMITHIGMIEVHDSDDKLLGYISKDLCAKALACYNPSVKDALVVTFTTNQLSTGLSTKLDLTATNMIPPYTFLGLTQGNMNADTDLRPTSWHFLAIGGIDAPGTRPGAPPSKIGNSYSGTMSTAESAVWSYDHASGALTPQWVNNDGSSPHEEFFACHSNLYIGGSKKAFGYKFKINCNTVVTIKFKFVPV